MRKLNKLIELSYLQRCVVLRCYDNNLKRLPELPNCHSLNCSGNDLEDLPELPMCHSLNCSGNKIDYSTIEEYRANYPKIIRKKKLNRLKKVGYSGAAKLTVSSGLFN